MRLLPRIVSCLLMSFAVHACPRSAPIVELVELYVSRVQTLTLSTHPWLSFIAVTYLVHTHGDLLRKA